MQSSHSARVPDGPRNTRLQRIRRLLPLPWLVPTLVCILPGRELYFYSRVLFLAAFRRLLLSWADLAQASAPSSSAFQTADAMDDSTPTEVSDRSEYFGLSVQTPSRSLPLCCFAFGFHQVQPLLFDAVDSLDCAL